MAVEVSWLCYSVFLTLVICHIIAEVPHKRFEYKYSFKPPYLAQKDGSVPFWEYGGSKFMSSGHLGVPRKHSFQLLRCLIIVCITVLQEFNCIDFTHTATISNARPILSRRLVRLPAAE